MTFEHCWLGRCVAALCIACLWTLLSHPVSALQLRPKDEAPDIQHIFNPKPLPGDIALPMPGGLGMVLRAVCLPAAGYLDDANLSFGVSASGGEDAALSAAWADQQYKASLLAPFELADIPASWDKSVLAELNRDPASAATAQNGLRSFLYFIGKYEVTRGQWRAVMHVADGAVFKPEINDDRPMTNISWFEAVEFTRRYSEWLMRNHPECLPFFQQEKRSSFVRLPTEAEWEYAARGGHKVSPAERDRTRLHPAPEGADMGEYIIAAQYDSKLSDLAAVGTRKPNPLGLYDMLGNSAEMVQTPFQLVAAGHLIGNQGGFVIKGGSCRAFSEASLHPGRRVEAAYYIEGGAQRRDDLGFRVGLGTILTPKDRQATMRSEWERRSEPHSAPGAPAEDVRVVIQEVVREVESPVLRRRLAEAEEMASRYHAQVNTNEERMMHELLLGATFSLETLANYGSRCFQLIRLMDAYAALSPKEREGQAAQIVKMRHEIKGFVRGMQGALYYYRNMRAATASMDTPRLLQQLEKLRLQFVHEDGFSRNMGKRLAVLRRHIELGQKVLAGRSEWQELRDILPDWLLLRLEEYWGKL